MGDTMTTYAIGLYDVWDWSWHKEYRDPVTKLIEKHGGKYTVRSSICPWEMLEGGMPVKSMKPIVLNVNAFTKTPRAKIATMRRTRELTDEDDKHKRWKAKREGRGSHAGTDLDDLPPEDKEVLADLLHEADAEDVDLNPASDAEHMRAIAEEIIKRNTHAKGGDNRLTPEDREQHRRIRETTERFIAEGKV